MTKPSWKNLVLTLEQYRVLMERKRWARINNERVRYKDLVEAWGIKQHHMATAVFRGIKRYDYILWKEQEQPR